MHLPVLFPLKKRAKMAGSIHAFDMHEHALSNEGFRVRRAERAGPMRSCVRTTPLAFSHSRTDNWALTLLVMLHGSGD